MSNPHPLLLRTSGKDLALPVRSTSQAMHTQMSVSFDNLTAPPLKHTLCIYTEDIKMKFATQSRRRSSAQVICKWKKINPESLCSYAVEHCLLQVLLKTRVCSVPKV